jgi:hypothetical protein
LSCILIITAVNEFEAFDETDCVRAVFQIKTDEWNVKSKLDVGNKWGHVFGFSGGKVKMFLLKMNCCLLNCFDPSGNNCRA